MSSKPSKPWAYLFGLLVGIVAKGAFWVFSVYLAIMILRYMAWL
jgi:hypothetical protein